MSSFFICGVEKSSFLTDLSTYEILHEYYVFDSPAGVCIRICYSNGDFEIISCDYLNKSYCGYIGSFYSDGSVKEFKGSFASYYSFTDLLGYFKDDYI